MNTMSALGARANPKWAHANPILFFCQIWMQIRSWWSSGCSGQCQDTLGLGVGPHWSDGGNLSWLCYIERCFVPIHLKGVMDVYVGKQICRPDESLPPWGETGISTTWSLGSRLAHKSGLCGFVPIIPRSFASASHHHHAFVVRNRNIQCLELPRSCLLLTLQEGEGMVLLSLPRWLTRNPASVVCW